MTKREHLVLSAVGPDRVGLVQRIAGFVAEHGANIEDSTMAALSGEFAIIMLVSGEPQVLDGIRAGRGALSERTGLTVLMRRPGTEEGKRTGRAVLTASCLDHPGVVHQLTSVLSEEEINIESMETRTDSAPESGAPLFQFEARLSLPQRVDLARLKERLRAIGQEQNIEVKLKLSGA